MFVASCLRLKMAEESQYTASQRYLKLCTRRFTTSYRPHTLVGISRNGARKVGGQRVVFRNQWCCPPHRETAQSTLLLPRASIEGNFSRKENQKAFH